MTTQYRIKYHKLLQTHSGKSQEKTFPFSCPENKHSLEDNPIVSGFDCPMSFLTYPMNLNAVIGETNPTSPGRHISVRKV